MMTYVNLDAELFDKLHGFSEPLAIRDQNGRVVALVTPTPEGAGSFPIGISEEELEDRRKNPGRLYTTAEVIEHLESL